MKKHQAYALIAATTLSAIAIAGCKKKKSPAPTHERTANRSVILSGPSVAYIRTELATAASQVSSRALVGRISFDERHVARLGPPVPGRVANIQVVPGDKVKKDDVLLTIHAPDIASAQAQVAQARSARLLADRASTRAAMLMQQGAGSEAEKQQAEAGLVQARNEEQRATAALAAIGGGSGSSDYQLRSPIDGVVVDRNVSVGAQVHTDQDLPLITVADLQLVWVVGEIYEQDLQKVHQGDPVTVTLLAFADRKWDSKIDYVSGTLDPQTRAAHARVVIPNDADFSLRPGMFARIEVHSMANGAASVPMSSLLARRDQMFVFTQAADGSYVEHEVQIGEQTGEHVTITSGINVGDRVVTEGAILLDAEANDSL